MSLNIVVCVLAVAVALKFWWTVIAGAHRTMLDIQDSMIALALGKVDLDGGHTIGGARAAYARGDIEVEEFEQRVDLLLRAEDQR